MARRAATDALATTLEVLPLDREVVWRYRALVDTAGFHRRRTIDRLIAATSLANGLRLVTINGDDFRDLPGRSLEVWSAQ